MQRKELSYFFRLCNDSRLMFSRKTLFPRFLHRRGKKKLGALTVRALMKIACTVMQCCRMRRYSVEGKEISHLASLHMKVLSPRHAPCARGEFKGSPGSLHSRLQRKTKTEGSTEK